MALDKKRKWLKRNEIFFKIITTVLLAFMAIIISYEANQIASYQNKIMDYQTEILKAEYQPILSFAVDLKYDQNTSSYTKDELIILNEGAAIRKFNANEMTFFYFNNYYDDGSYDRIRIPIYGYYDTAFVYSNSEGKLVEMICGGLTEGNWYRVNTISREFEEFEREQNNDIVVFCRFVRFIEVTYNDLLGEEHHEVYHVSDFGSYPMPNDECMNIIEEYNTGAIILSDTTSESLYEHWLSRLS